MDGLVEWASQLGVTAAIALYLVHFITKSVSVSLSSISESLRKISYMQEKIVHLQEEIVELQKIIISGCVTHKKGERL